jgi:hypothetical protein
MSTAENLLSAITEYVYWSCAEVKADMRQIDQGESRRKEQAENQLMDALREAFGDKL